MILEIWGSILLGSIFFAFAIYSPRPWKQKHLSVWADWREWTEAIVATALLMAGLFWIWT